MKIQTKIKKVLKKNLWKILLVGIPAMIGVAANINLLMLDYPVSADLNVPHGERYRITVFEPESEKIREATAYNVGDPSQTDGSPCIGASQENLCTAVAQGEKICAANFVPLNTYLYVENYGICRVADRMNSRFENRIDIALQAHEKDRAVKFGLQNLEVSVLK